MESLTHSQRSIWVGQNRSPDAPIYNMALAWVFDGSIDSALFRQAWERVVRQCDVLRLVLEQPQGDVRPQIRETGPGTRILDFQDRPEPMTAFRQWTRARCREPIPLDDHLVDSVLVDLGDGRSGWYLNQHHLITDAGSEALLFRQVAAEYSALQGGPKPEPLEPYYPTAAGLVPRDELVEKATAHWEQRSRRRSFALYGRTARSQGTASTRLTLRLTEVQSRGIDRLAEERGFGSLSGELSRFTVFATLLLSWLHRVTGEGDLAFDAPVSGRPTAAAKRSLGPFIELFPFWATIEPGETFRSLGTKCLEEASLLLRHSLPGLSALSVGTANPVVLNYIPDVLGEFAGLPAEVEWVHPGHGDSVHALRLQVHDFEDRGRYTLHFDCNEDVFPPLLRERSVKHFETLLDGMLRDPDRKIAALDIRTEEERRSQDDFLVGPSTAPTDRTVVEMFAAQAARTPDAVALRESMAEVSFRHLQEQSEAVAAAIVGSGVEPGDRVAVLARRSPETVAAVLGVLRARAAWVPIDPKYPPARIEWMVTDSGTRLLLVDETSAAAAPVANLPVLGIDEAIDTGRGLPLTVGDPEPDDLAYLIYTSGSTGRPKGVLVEHRGLTSYLDWASRQYVRGDRLSFGLFTSLSFDLTLTSLFLPMVTGGTLKIYPEGDGSVDSALLDLIHENAVDFIKLTPSHLSLLRQADLQGTRIRRIVVGGEDFKVALAAAIEAQADRSLEIYNEYGPTEAVVGCMLHRYRPDRDLGERVPIGGPADDVYLRVLNEELVAVPEGVPGELWVGRSGLARGYHGLTEETNRHFREDPSGSGRRIYRTGDCVRFVEPQALEFLGRLDRQLKISGHRIEPGEIESALLEIPGIEQAAVLVSRESPTRSARLGEAEHCTRCGLPSDYPLASFDDSGVCSLCRAYDSADSHVEGYFRSMSELEQLFEESRRQHTAEYDCLLLLSGGKDSTYALCRLVDMGVSVYAFTLDNGYISDGAKENMRRVTEALGVPLEMATTPAMNAIFRDSLTRFSNVCHGCFKTIYTLSLNRANELGIPIIVTGLSRGQMFETRLTPEMFRDGRRTPEEVDAAVLAARKVYHRVDDEVAHSLDVRIFEDNRIFETVRFVDFYRYCDVDLAEILAHLERSVPWVRPPDTGRSTNCLINDAGIYVHKRERGFHNYALPYSWDVRLGQKTRDQALDELDDEIDVESVRAMLEEIGYDEDRRGPGNEEVRLAAFFVSSEDPSITELRRHLAETLPQPLIPAILQRVESVPLTESGKIDDVALAGMMQPMSASTRGAPPAGPVEEFLAGVWREQLHCEADRESDYFALGGTSLGAMELMIRLCREFDIELSLDAPFRKPVLRELAALAEDRILGDVAEMGEDELRQLGRLSDSAD